MTKRKRSTPPLDPEASQNKSIALAIKQAEKELEAGTASSQIVTHYLKESTKRAELELRRTELEILLLQEKIESAKTQRSIESMFQDVLGALKSYTVQPHDYD